MKTKTLKVNDVDVVCSHVTAVNDKTGQVHVHLKVKAGDGVETEHVLTIGADDKPLPASYDTAALQKDLDKFRQHHAEMAESNNRAKKLAEGIE